MASQIAKDKGYKSIKNFGDSEMLIKKLNPADCFNNSAMNRTLQRIRNTMKEFDKVAFFHILRDLNNSANTLANKACLLSQGFLCINGEPSYHHPIP